MLRPPMKAATPARKSPRTGAAGSSPRSAVAHAADGGREAGREEQGDEARHTEGEGEDVEAIFEGLATVQIGLAPTRLIHQSTQSINPINQSINEATNQPISQVVKIINDKDWITAVLTSKAGSYGKAGTGAAK